MTFCQCLSVLEPRPAGLAAVCASFVHDVAEGLFPAAGHGLCFVGVSHLGSLCPWTPAAALGCIGLGAGSTQASSAAAVLAVFALPEHQAWLP